jgi:hypothetical protein
LDLATIRRRADRDVAWVEDTLALLDTVDRLQLRIDSARAWLAFEVGSLPTGDERNELARLAGFVCEQLYPVEVSSGR